MRKKGIPRIEYLFRHAARRHAVASDAVLMPFALRVPEKGTLRRPKWPALIASERFSGVIIPTY